MRDLPLPYVVSKQVSFPFPSSDTEVIKMWDSELISATWSWSIAMVWSNWDL